MNGDFILGHECAGVVEKTGAKVKDLNVGNRVALEPGCTCGVCEFCKTGHYNLCKDVEFLATPPYHGCLEQYIAYPANMCFKLPDGMNTRKGALVEPLAVGIHAARQGGVTLGSSVIILGAGCIGLVTLMACKAFGATDITVVDVLSKRLKYTEKLGATRVIDASRCDSVKEILNKRDGEGTDFVFETAGSAVTIAQTPILVKRGGTIVLVGMEAQNVIPYDFSKIMAKEATIKSVFRYRNIYLQAIQAIAEGKIPVQEIVTHEFDFAQTAEAFDFVIDHKSEVVKAVIKIS